MALRKKKDSYTTFAYDFLKLDILVVCPSCSNQAIVKPGNFTFRNRDENDVKVICTKCGFNKRLSQTPSSVLYTSIGKAIVGRHYVMGGGIDPFFHLELWLKTEVEGHWMWAYNFEHLNFLREHVEAKLRERNGQSLTNRSIGSRLPRWMTSRRNREIVLKKVSELQNK
ncbi:hypothetical protein WSM22_36020 [Cytophagales bacterium WSM2-2]|nr:hypothetical protein WSM22_36020 [Cytophagales bacterium WSM2-2]